MYCMKVGRMANVKTRETVKGILNYSVRQTKAKSILTQLHNPPTHTHTQNQEQIGPYVKSEGPCSANQCLQEGFKGSMKTYKFKGNCKCNTGAKQ